MAKKKVKQKTKKSSKKVSRERKDFGNVKTVLIVTEKPQAAAKIADALSNGKDDKFTDKNKVSFYEFAKNGKRVIVGCAVGHLYGVQQKVARGPFPNFDVEWKPTHERKKSGFTKKYFDVLKKLVKEADEVIVATDHDVEGEVIGWNVVRFIAKRNDAKRMKFSSLTKDSLEESYENLSDSLDWGMALAGETRHYLDWFYGINLSRGLMRALTTTGKFRILSIGRVQGPALKIIYDREIEIKDFVPTPFWEVFLLVQDLNKNKIEVSFPKKIEKKSELLKFQHLKGKKGFATTTIKEDKISPPTPFDLTTLQTEAYKFCGLTPSQTLKVAQSLYLAGVISYPRTSSQKYPEGIGYDKILKQLKKYTTLVKYAVNKKPVEGKKDDPAHPAIYPTGEKKKLREVEKKVYDLIVKRFVACFCDAALVENKKVSVDVGGLKFSATGNVIKEKNWMAVYPSKLKEEKIPTVEGEVDVLEIRTEEKQTKPPKRYTAASLVKELEKRNLGTKATRSSIVQTLFDRGYLDGKSIEVSELGLKMVETLMKYSPEILDEELTRKMEQELEEIETQKAKNLEKKEEEILGNAKKEVSAIATKMRDNFDKIGKNLADANEAVYEKEREENTMSECPVCKKGKLRVMYGKKFERYFVSCDAYPKCKTIYSLPPKGLMKPARDKENNLEFCQECGFPLVVSMKKGSRPWKFCFNPACKTNEEWVKKKEEFKKKIESGEVKVDENN